MPLRFCFFGEQIIICRTTHPASRKHTWRRPNVLAWSPPAPLLLTRTPSHTAVRPHSAGHRATPTRRFSSRTSATSRRTKVAQKRSARLQQGPRHRSDHRGARQRQAHRPPLDTRARPHLTRALVRRCLGSGQVRDPAALLTPDPSDYTACTPGALRYGFVVRNLHSSIRVFSASRNFFHSLMSSLLIVPAGQADRTRFCVASFRFRAFNSAPRAVHVGTKLNGPRDTVAWRNPSAAPLYAARAFLHAPV
jgi:hypothetical protein